MPYDSSPSWAMRRPPLVPVLIVSAGTLIAVIFWCLPSLSLFSEAIANLPALWQIESNHQVILVLVIRVLSPLFVAAILAACCWIASAIVPFLPAARKQTRAAEMAKPIARASQATLPVARPGGTSQPPIVQTGALHPSGRAAAPPSLGTPARPVMPGPAPASQTSRPDDMLSPLARSALERQEQAPAPAPHNEVAASSTTASPVHTQTPPPASAPQSLTSAPDGTSTHAPQVRSSPAAFIEISLLEDARIEVVAPDGRRRQVALAPKGVKRIQLLAYIAWQRGKLLDRDTMVEAIFGHGLSDEDASPQRLSDAFDSHRKFLRQDLRACIDALNATSGAEVISPRLDLFTLQNKCWTLASHCRVIDLDSVEAEYAIIEAARRDGRLANVVPQDVKAACDRLLAAYSGDFLARLVRERLADLDPWYQSWLRKPYTLYRDRPSGTRLNMSYMQAIALLVHLIRARRETAGANITNEPRISTINTRRMPSPTALIPRSRLAKTESGMVSVLP